MDVFFGHGVHVEAKKNQKLIDTGMWHKKSMGDNMDKKLLFPHSKLEVWAYIIPSCCAIPYLQSSSLKYTYCPSWSLDQPALIEKCL